MGVVHIGFVLAFSLSGSELPENIEELYQTKYKKILSFLYRHPEMRISLFVSGRILEWIEKKHDEIISICSEMIDRRQIEVLGGAYNFNTQGCRKKTARCLFNGKPVGSFSYIEF